MQVNLNQLFGFWHQNVSKMGFFKYQSSVFVSIIQKSQILTSKFGFGVKNVQCVRQNWMQVNLSQLFGF